MILNMGCAQEVVILQHLQRFSSPKTCLLVRQAVKSKGSKWDEKCWIYHDMISNTYKTFMYLWHKLRITSNTGFIKIMYVFKILALIHASSWSVILSSKVYIYTRGHLILPDVELIMNFNTNRPGNCFRNENIRAIQWSEEKSSGHEIEALKNHCQNNFIIGAHEEFLNLLGLFLIPSSLEMQI